LSTCQEILQLIPGAGSFFGDVEGILKDTLTLNFPGLLGDAAKLVPDLISFVGQQLGLGLSLIALLGQATSAKTVSRCHPSGLPRLLFR
jgi:hypothetical protein